MRLFAVLAGFKLGRNCLLLMKVQRGFPKPESRLSRICFFVYCNLKKLIEFSTIVI